MTLVNYLRRGIFFSQVIDMKTLSFHVNLLVYKILLWVINKIEAKIQCLSCK